MERRTGSLRQIPSLYTYESEAGEGVSAVSTKYSFLQYF